MGHTMQEDVDEAVLGVHENQRHFEKEGTIGSIGSQMECSVMTHNLGLKGFKFVSFLLSNSTVQQELFKKWVLGGHQK